MTYLIIFVILIALAIWDLQFEDRMSKDVLLLVSTMLLAGLAALRYETGGDWDTYAKIYADLPRLAQIMHDPNLLKNESAEPLFVLLCSALRELTKDMQLLFAVVAVFDLSLLALGVRRYTHYPCIAMLCYYGILYFNLEFIYIRQAMAIAVCFYALRYIEEKQLLKYVLFVLVGTLLHQTVIVMLPLYWLLNKSYSKTAYCVIIGAGCVMMLAGITWFSDLFHALTSAVGGGVADKGDAYVKEGVFAAQRTITLGFIINLLLFAVVMVFKEKIEAHRYGKLHVNMYVLSLAIYYYCYELIEVSNRLRLMFFISIIVVLPEIIHAMPEIYTKLVAYGVVVLYCFTFSRGIMLERPQAAAYNPYQNYIEYKIGRKHSTGAERLEQSHKSFNQDRKR